MHINKVNARNHLVGKFRNPDDHRHYIDMSDASFDEIADTVIADADEMLYLRKLKDDTMVAEFLCREFWEYAQRWLPK